MKLDKKIYTYGLGLVVIGIVLYLLYYAYNSFKANQGSAEPECKVESDESDDINIDVEIEKLRKAQDRNLKTPS